MLTKFKIEKPIIQAPMAGATSPEFVAACCEAGVAGFIGAGYLDEADTRTFIREVKELTDKVFGVNLFVQEEPKIDVTVLQEARMALQPIYEELGITNTSRVVSDELFEGQIQAILDEEVPVVSFTFGIPPQDVIHRLKNKGIFVIGTATTKEEATAVEEAGFDAIVLQGKEAGGHHGSFREPAELIPVRKLLKQVAGTVHIPLIAAGGIMTEGQIKEMLLLGADAVQVGTVLLPADESSVSIHHKEAILQSAEGETCITSAFTGKPARGQRNAFTKQLEHAIVAPYPLQHHLTQKIRQESAKAGRPEYLSLWMGENSHMARRGTVKEIIDSLWE